MPCMRQHVQQANSQHQTRDKADRNLEPCMGELGGEGQPSSGQGGDDDQAAVDGDQDWGGEGGVVVHRGMELSQILNVVSYVYWTLAGTKKSRSQKAAGLNRISMNYFIKRI